MAPGQLSGVIQNLRRTALLSDGAATDGQLLDDFIAHADEAAFEALVRRHGGMVWGVCSRVLGHSHDAEDAFQAAFLVLVRKAESVRPREMVGNWLYGVAYRTALKARGVANRRGAREKQVEDMPAKEVQDAKVWSDLRPLLDRELNRLADRYRVPVVLCDLEGKSQREAARQLGWPAGTLTTRLTRARKMLARRLSRQGIALSASALVLAAFTERGPGHAASAAGRFNRHSRGADRGRSSGNVGGIRAGRRTFPRSPSSHVSDQDQKRFGDCPGRRPGGLGRGLDRPPCYCRPIARRRAESRAGGPCAIRCGVPRNAINR